MSEQARDSDGGTPSADGRDTLGRFTEGNTAAKGVAMPHAKRAAAWRHAFAAAVDPSDVMAVAVELVKRARAGERWAMTELLDRACGPARETAVNILNIAADEATRKRIILERLPDDDTRRHLAAFQDDDDPDIIDGEAVHRLPGPADTDPADSASGDGVKTCEQNDNDLPDDCADSCAAEAPGGVTEGSGSVTEHPSHIAPETPRKASEAGGYDEARWTDIGDHDGF